MKSVAFLIGNGASRQHIDLERLRGLGTIVGCNALYRDFRPDVLLAIDQKMLTEICGSSYDGYCVMPANRPGNYKKFNKIKLPQLNTSGCAGIHYTGLCNFDIVFLIGFDCYHGNVYARSPNYSNGTSNFSGFLRYYKTTMEKYSSTTYYNVIRDGKDGLTDSLHSLDNYGEPIGMKYFLEHLVDFNPQEPIIFHERFNVGKDGAYSIGDEN